MENFNLHKNKISKKSVNFDLNKNIIHQTYSPKEYDRTSIRSLMFRSFQYEWTNMKMEINDYKLLEMIVHMDNIHFIRFY